MPRRSILSAADRIGLLALPDTEDELIRHYTFGDFLILLLTLDELVAVTERNGLGELVRPLSFVELLLDGLPELEVITVFQNEEGLRNLPEFLQCPVQRVLPGVGVQAFEKLGGCPCRSALLSRVHKNVYGFLLFLQPGLKLCYSRAIVLFAHPFALQHF